MYKMMEREREREEIDSFFIESFGQEGDSSTALQRHAEFFDRNKDGIIYPRETYTGERQLRIS